MATLAKKAKLPIFSSKISLQNPFKRMPKPPVLVPSQGTPRDLFFLIAFTAILLLVAGVFAKMIAIGGGLGIASVVFAGLFAGVGLVRNAKTSASLLENRVILFLSLLCVGYVSYIMFTAPKKEEKKDEKK